MSAFAPFTDLAFKYLITEGPNLGEPQKLKRDFTSETSFPNLARGAFQPTPQDLNNTLREQAIVSLKNFYNGLKDFQLIWNPVPKYQLNC